MGRWPRLMPPTTSLSPPPGSACSYDALLVAVGAGSEPAFRHVLTWTPETDAELFGGLLRDLDEGYLKRVAFVVPPGVAWALPAYELALMTAWQAWGMGHDDVQVTLYTPRTRRSGCSARRQPWRCATTSRRRACRPRPACTWRRTRRPRPARPSSRRADARRRASRRAATGGRTWTAGASRQRPRLHPHRPARQSPRRRRGLGGRGRDRLPGQAGRARVPAGRRGGRVDRRPRRRRAGAPSLPTGAPRHDAHRPR